MKYLLNLKLHPLMVIIIIMLTCLMVFAAIVDADEMPILQIEMHLPYISK